MEMKLGQTGGLLVSTTIWAGSATRYCWWIHVKALHVCTDGFLFFLFYWFFSILILCFKNTTTMWKTLHLLIWNFGWKFKVPLGTNYLAHADVRQSGLQWTRRSFFSPLEAWQQTRRRPLHPQQGPGERRGRATSRVVNNQREAERKERGNEWEGSLKEQAWDKKRKIKWRPRGCSKERRSEVRGRGFLQVRKSRQLNNIEHLEMMPSLLLCPLFVNDNVQKQ